MLCACGCGEQTRIATRTSRRDGSVKGQPNKYVNSGHAVASTPVEYVEDGDGCWVWQRPLNRKGYGSKHDPRTGTCRMAHRVYYERVHGPIDRSVHLHHLCGKPACVNPDHLAPVDNREHGGDITAEAIRRLRAAGVSEVVLAHAFQITPDKLRRIA